jgi:hypothetical protein
MVCEHIFLLDKAHLHVELVEIGGRPVGAGVFIAETRGDLEILVEARHHQKLLELLRGLGQRVELARVQPRGHEEVARALGRGRRDDRRLVFTEPDLPHPAPDRCDNIGSQHHVFLHLFPAQIEVAIGQPGFFRVFLIAEHLQRQIAHHRPQHLHVADEHLDLAGGQFRVHKLRLARLHGAVDADANLGAQLFHLGKDRAVGVAQHLRDPVMVAQVDEDHAAMVAPPVDPSAEPDGFAHIRAAVSSAQVWLR